MAVICITINDIFVSKS